MRLNSCFRKADDSALQLQLMQWEDKEITDCEVSS